MARVNKIGEKIGFYLNQLPTCGHSDRLSVVRDWVGDIASEESDRAAMEWADAITRIMPPLREKIDALTPIEREIIFNAMFTSFYLLYDIKKDFASQLNANTDILSSFLQMQFGISEADNEEN